MSHPYCVKFETNLISETENRNFFFDNPIEILEAYTLKEAETILRNVEIYINKGYYLAGYISYETGYLFEESFKRKWMDIKFSSPLIWFGVYVSPKVEVVTKEKTFKFTKENSFSIQNLFLDLDFQTYEKKILKILEHIKNGETYQVNFSFRMNFDFVGDVSALYESLVLSQKVSYSAYIHDGKREILSLSPELFFKRKQNKIITKPMKGTSPKGKSQLDDNSIIQNLKKDSKTKAENSMIVDLIRNDLGKISEIGSVKVTHLLEVEEYETLFQMTSTITSNLKQNLTYFELFKAIFPGGSITGAPKYKTIQIINELETSHRGIYTGAIGFISKEEAIFNIPIRTLEIQNGKGKMGLGSGIVWDSTPSEEYKECILKQKFFINSIHFELIESILLKNGKWILLDSHLLRLKKSAEYFGFDFFLENILQSLEALRLELIRDRYFESFKVKLTLSKKGKVILEYSNILKKSKQVNGKIKINTQKVYSTNIFQIHKTSNRHLYDTEYKKALQLNLVDYIFLNEKEEIVESCIYNLFIKKAGNFYTPPIDSGCLPGVMREYLLKKKLLKEKTLTLKDLYSAEAIYLCNSVRGIKKVNLDT
ncbi:MAG: aminodeoxychorismate synthase component I [Leptospiraceae bacterium]|nr:aminodeoxychorismate synthase component I [Leptospiraceae bacterium]